MRIALIEETGSTNADLAIAIRSATPPVEGDWLITRRQNAGRGRQGRSWADELGNFMGSTVVDAHPDDPPPASLSFVAALAVADAAKAALGDGDSASKLQLKWPNDVMLNGGKLSGILLEMVQAQVVVGIGVNLAQAPELPDRKTAAISDFAPQPDLEDFSNTLAQYFAKRLNQWRTAGLAAILRAFATRSVHSIGTQIRVHDSDGSYVQGSFAGLEADDGALRLRLADGSERVIRAGDIT